MESRYRQLHLQAALSRRSDYAQACRELGAIFRRVYNRAPKAFQLVLYEDVLTAFRLLAGMDLFEHRSGARVLIRAVDATLPKKKRAIALSEFKHAALLQYRLWVKPKISQEAEAKEYTLELSEDLLKHIFGFLDVRTLAISSTVCKAWKEAIDSDLLWRRHYFAMFPVPRTSRNIHGVSETRRLESGKNISGAYEGEKGYWQKAVALKISEPGGRSQLLLSNRAFCPGCQSLFWISERPRIQENGKFCWHQDFTARPVHRTQVVTFILREPQSSISSSSSDSDSDIEGYFKAGDHTLVKSARIAGSRLWSYPRIETE